MGFRSWGGETAPLGHRGGGLGLNLGCLGSFWVRGGSAPLPGLDGQDVVLHDVHFGVPPGLGGAVGGPRAPPAVGHVVAAVVGVAAVLIPIKNGGKKGILGGAGEKTRF